MNQSPVGSFLRFVLVFTIFIALSLGLTVAVNNYANARDSQSMQAAAAAKLLGK